MNRKPIFDAVRKLLGRSFTTAEVRALDGAIDLSTASALDAPAGPEPLHTGQSPRSLGQAGSRLIKKWEGCERRRADGSFDAYPDPGSADGQPWTIGWGSTGADVRKGVVWSQAQCDARFAKDIVSYVGEVDRFVGGAPTTQNQFDALVSFHYNTGAIAKSTLGKLHREGRFAEARQEFARWIYNNGKPMNGLRSRRADEAMLYATG